MRDKLPLPPRGATANPDSRYAAWRREAVDDGWPEAEAPPPLRTEVGVDTSRTVISYNQSPDLCFDRSVNPYRGCEQRVHLLLCQAQPCLAGALTGSGLRDQALL